MIQASVDDRGCTSTTLAVADVGALLPGPGKEFAIVYNFQITWVQDALEALHIEVGDKNEYGGCKVALCKYYLAFNAAKSEVKEVDGSAAKSEIEMAVAPTTALADQTRAQRARGALLQSAPSPNQIAALHS